MDHKVASLELGEMTRIGHLPSLALYLLNTSCSDHRAFYSQLGLGTRRLPGLKKSLTTMNNSGFGEDIQEIGNKMWFCHAQSAGLCCVRNKAVG